MSGRAIEKTPQEIELEAVQKAIDLKNQARAEKARLRRERKAGQIPEASEAIAIKQPTISIADDPPVDKTDRTPAPPSTDTRALKRQRASSSAAHTSPIDTIDVPDSMVLPAPSEGISFGKACADSLYVTPEQAEILKSGAAPTSQNALAYASQTLLWIGAAASEAKKAELELGRSQQSLNKANQDNKVLSDRVKDLERREKEAVDKAADINMKMTELGAELEVAKKAKVDAQVDWFEKGIKQTLERAQGLGWDYKQLLGPNEFDPIEPESDGEEQQNNEQEGEN